MNSPKLHIHDYEYIVLYMDPNDGAVCQKGFADFDSAMKYYASIHTDNDPVFYKLEKLAQREYL